MIYSTLHMNNFGSSGLQYLMESTKWEEEKDSLSIKAFAVKYGYDHVCNNVMRCFFQNYSYYLIYVPNKAATETSKPITNITSTAIEHEKKVCAPPLKECLGSYYLYMELWISNIIKHIQSNTNIKKRYLEKHACSHNPALSPQETLLNIKIIWKSGSQLYLFRTKKKCKNLKKKKKKSSCVKLA